MFGTITEWFSDVKEEINSLEQEKKEAELDLMLLMMYADRYIDDNENKKIKELIESLTWENVEYHVELYIAKTIAEVRKAMVNEKRIKVFIEDISLRLNDNETRTKALNCAEKFMEIDFDISDQEKALYGTIKEIFNK